MTDFHDYEGRLAKYLQRLEREKFSKQVTPYPPEVAWISTSSKWNEIREPEIIAHAYM